MRSFIKSHRRKEFSISEDLELDPPPTINYSTPNSSPKLATTNQFSPSARTVQHESKNSPKKLLTPIKNLFTSSNYGSKNSSPIEQSKRPSYNPKPPVQGMIVASDIPRNYSFEKTRVVSTPTLKPGFSTSIPSLVSPFQETPQTSMASVNTSVPKSSQNLKLTSLKPAIVFSETVRPQTVRENSWNDSTTSIYDLESKIELKQVSFESPSHLETSISSSSDDISETSSQFSFIKDRKGGKNTSVKYYKAPTKPEAEIALIAQDLGYEEEDLEDYDFESNGLYDDFEEDDVNYNNAFDDYDDDADGDFSNYNQALDEDENSNLSYKQTSVDVPEHLIDYKPTFHDVDHDGLQETHLNCRKMDEELIKDNAFHDDSINFSYPKHKFISQERKLETCNTSLDNSTLKESVKKDGSEQNSDETKLINKNEHLFDQNYSRESNDSESLLDMAASYLKPSFNIENKNRKLYTVGIFDDLSCGKKPFYLSYHGSIEGFEETDIEPDGCNIYGEDILENYLDLSKHSSSDPICAEQDNLLWSLQEVDDVNESLYTIEIGSPIINGVTVGSNLNHRSRRKTLTKVNAIYPPVTNRSFIHRLGIGEVGHYSVNRSLYLDERTSSKSESVSFNYIESFHSSISDGLNIKIASKVEEFDRFSNLFNTDTIINENDSSNAIRSKLVRNSVNQMMTLLNSLELDSNKDIEPISQEGFGDKEVINNEQRRKSILGMMDMLANLNLTEPDSTKEASNISNEKMKDSRKSILDMMSTLDSIGSSDINNIITEKNKRESVDFMMNALEQLNAINTYSSDTQAA